MYHKCVYVYKGGSGGREGVRKKKAGGKEGGKGRKGERV